VFLQTENQPGYGNVASIYYSDFTIFPLKLSLISGFSNIDKILFKPDGKVISFSAVKDEGALIYLMNGPLMDTFILSITLCDGYNISQNYLLN